GSDPEQALLDARRALAEAQSAAEARAEARAEAVARAEALQSALEAAELRAVDARRELTALRGELDAIQRGAGRSNAVTVPDASATDRGNAERLRLKLEVDNLRKRLETEGVREIELALHTERRTLLEVREELARARDRADEAERTAESALELEARLRELEATARRVGTVEAERRALREMLEEERRRTLELEGRLSAVTGTSGRVGGRPGTLELVAPTTSLPGGEASPSTLEFVAIAESGERQTSRWDTRPAMRSTDAPHEGGAEDAESDGIVTPPPLPTVVSGRPRMNRAIASETELLAGPDGRRPTVRGRRPASTLELRVRDYVDGDAEGGSVVRRFVEDFPSHVVAIRDALGDGDAASIEATAGRIHEQFHGVGALRLAGIASHIELAASGGELSAVGSLLDALEAEFRRVRAALISAVRE
ncbi:MAG: hypothetical protein CVU56_22305, partial [Deltaproteobacteria bacterium HGW-Deltaproteobacteria-14]